MPITVHILYTRTTVIRELKLSYIFIGIFVYRGLAPRDVSLTMLTPCLWSLLTTLTLCQRSR